MIVRPKASSVFVISTSFGRPETAARVRRTTAKIADEEGDKKGEGLMNGMKERGGEGWMEGEMELKGRDERRENEGERKAKRRI